VRLQAGNVYCPSRVAKEDGLTRLELADKVGGGLQHQRAANSVRTNDAPGDQIVLGSPGAGRTPLVLGAAPSHPAVTLEDGAEGRAPNCEMSVPIPSGTLSAVPSGTPPSGSPSGCPLQGPLRDAMRDPELHRDRCAKRDEARCEARSPYVQGGPNAALDRSHT